MTAEPSHRAHPAPSSPEIANARLKAMRGRGIIGNGLHALGVRLGIAYNGSFFYPSEDRSILECLIIPYYQLSKEHQRIVFVGNDWYTQGYARMFQRKWFMTLDPNPERALYGAENNAVDFANNLERYVEPGSIDAIFLNGIIGWGLNELPAAEATFAAFDRCMRPGAHLLIGWNDLPEHKPFALSDIQALKPFKRRVFEPLGVDEYMIANEWRHTYSFFAKP
jgi:hypothetical protein